jgi:putative membrane protein
MIRLRYKSAMLPYTAPKDRVPRGRRKMNAISFWKLLTQMHSYDWGPGMSGWGFGMGWFWPPIIMLVIIIFIIVAIVVYLVRQKRPPSGPREDSALDILKKRYARGEINKEEFEEKRRHIES